MSWELRSSMSATSIMLSLPLIGPSPSIHAALKLSPDNLIALNNRADAWRSKRAFAKALADLDRANRVQPAFVEAYYTRAQTYQDMGDKERALTELHKAIDLDKAGTYRAYGEQLIANLGAQTNKTRLADNRASPATVDKRVALVVA